MTKKSRPIFPILLALHGLFGVYSLNAIFSKLASQSEFLSFSFVVFYFLVLVLLAFFAFGWQQAIKKLPLTTAYANKAVIVVWGILWGLIFFGEQLSIGKIIGAIIVVGGIVLLTLSDKAEQNE